MRILIIGGKKFLGYHIAKEATERGHDVTFFNRGLTYTELMPEIQNIIGDRNVSLDALKNKSFDVVIDTCAYFPHQIDSALEFLKNKIKKYVLISTLSAIKADTKEYDESIEIIGLDYESSDITGGSYGPLKAACEKQVMDQFKNHIILRPGYIVGERDHTDRFTFWPVMMKNLDQMIVPKSENMMYKYIDVKDLAAFTIHSIETDLQGIYHISGPEENLHFSDFIKTCQSVVNPDCQLIPVNAAEFNDSPVYMSFPQYDDVQEGHVIYSGNFKKAFDAGLKQRPLKDTILDALNWFNTYKGDPKDLAAGVSIEELKVMTKSHLKSK